MSAMPDFPTRSTQQQAFLFAHVDPIHPGLDACFVLNALIVDRFSARRRKEEQCKCSSTLCNLTAHQSSNGTGPSVLIATVLLGETTTLSKAGKRDGQPRSPWQQADLPCPLPIPSLGKSFSIASSFGPIPVSILPGCSPFVRTCTTSCRPEVDMGAGPQSPRGTASETSSRSQPS